MREDGFFSEFEYDDAETHQWVKRGCLNEVNSPEDRLALMSLFDATNGRKWEHNENWGTHHSLSRWHGVMTDEEGKVIEVKLDRNRLDGEVPEQIAKLANARTLDLSMNQLQGTLSIAVIRMRCNGCEVSLHGNDPGFTLPSNIDELDVTTLNLASCSLKGDVSDTAFPLLCRVESFDFSGNNLSNDPINRDRGLDDPSARSKTTFCEWCAFKFDNLRDETCIDAHCCGLKGPIPDGIETLTNMVELDLHDNEALEGDILPKLCDLTNLRRLDLHFTKFGGGVSHKFYELLCQMEFFDLSDTDYDQSTMSGWLACNKTNLKDVHEIKLINEGLGGTLPEVLPPSLVTLELGPQPPRDSGNTNTFEGGIPEAWGSFTRLKHLNLRNCGLSGVLPLPIIRLKVMGCTVVLSSNRGFALPSNIDELDELDITTLDLGSCSLVDAIPGQIGRLTQMTELRLSNSPAEKWLASFNHLSGAFPPEVSRCTRIKTLELGGNKFEGPPLPSLLDLLAPLKTTLETLSIHGVTGFGDCLMPASITEFSKLKTVDLRSMSLRGPPLPDALRLLEPCTRTLQALLLSGNPNMGGCELPIEQLRRFANVHTLFLGAMNLRGLIPVDLGEMTRLVHLSLDSNRFSGPPLPETLHLLKPLAPSLRRLDLSGNKQLCAASALSNATATGVEDQDALMCPITRELMTDPVVCADGHTYERSAIEHWLSTHDTSPKTGLELEHTGLVPNHAIRAAIDDARARETAYRGGIPEELFHFNKLEQLDLADLDLNGEIPAEFSRLTALERLYLCNNKLCGEIPKCISALSRLELIDLSHNQLTGEVMDFDLFGLLCRIPKFDFSNNLLTQDTLPGWLAVHHTNLDQMKEIDVRKMELTGPLPAVMPPSLEIFHVSDNIKTKNKLTDGAFFHRSWDTLVFLKELSLVAVRLQGRIPEEIGSMANLEDLQLHFNALDGPIPKGIGKLVKLRRLNLSTNKLTHRIPSEMTRLDRLHELSLASNRFEIPPDCPLDREGEMEYMGGRREVIPFMNCLGRGY